MGVKTYETGDNILSTEGEMTEYGINETRPDKRYTYPECNQKLTKTHYQKIAVYGDEELRDRILKLLQDNPE